MILAHHLLISCARQHVTIHKLRVEFIGRISFKGDGYSLRRTMKELGFQWKMMANDRMVLAESRHEMYHTSEL